MSLRCRQKPDGVWVRFQRLGEISGKGAMASAESARSGGGGSSSAAGAQEACAQGTPGCCSDAWCSEQRKGPVCNRCATEVDGVLDPDEYVCACKHQTETELYEGALDDAIWCALDNHGLRPLNMRQRVARWS